MSSSSGTPELTKQLLEVYDDVLAEGCAFSVVGCAPEVRRLMASILALPTHVQQRDHYIVFEASVLHRKAEKELAEALEAEFVPVMLQRVDTWTYCLKPVATRPNVLQLFKCIDDVRDLVGRRVLHGAWRLLQDIGRAPSAPDGHVFDVIRLSPSAEKAEKEKVEKDERERRAAEVP